MVIEFYEKQGCAGNARQKEKLSSLGCMLSVKNLLSTKWDKRELAEYFVGKPVHEWFNASAPSIKDGLINIYALSESEALEAMIKEPILIKRPLLKSGTVKISGFDPDELKAKLGLEVNEAPATCLAGDACNQVL
jgi:nitrogenase-associated protein